MNFFENKDDIYYALKRWDRHSVTSIQKEFSNISSQNIKLNLDKIEFIDTSAAMFLLATQKDLAKKGRILEFYGGKENTQKIIVLCAKFYLPHNFHDKTRIFLGDIFSVIGKFCYGYFETFLEFLSFVGGSTFSFFNTLLQPSSFRFRATLFHMQKNGLNALPIIALTSLLIGFVIAFQGAVQLQKFGANIFIVEMVGISAMRELAPLIVAIVIAGRSSSAYTAELGVMKITQEVDAMKTLGFDPWIFLILPRVVALVISLPLLVVFADFVSIFGGMLVAKNQLDIGFLEFINRFHQEVELKQFLIGICKAPIFGWIIAIIGCFRGFMIDSNTQSVGKYTTISVVNAIFWVIAFDAIASVFLTKLNL